MTNKSNFRAIAIAVLLLTVSASLQAQVGRGALDRARNAAQGAVNQTQGAVNQASDAANSATNQAAGAVENTNNSAPTVKIVTEMPAALEGKGVIINGVIWANCNVAAPGAFADKPEDTGMWYQWNRKPGWSGEPVKSTQGEEKWNEAEQKGRTWEAENDPSPDGWRVPNREEMKRLFDETKVSNEWTTVNGVNGRKFTDIASGNSIFLPAAGERHQGNGRHNSANQSGDYWSSTEGHFQERQGVREIQAVKLSFSAAFAKCDNFNFYPVNYGYSVRPVAK
jgi:uncharacterized protein (TIGR02145 family)